MGKKDKKKGKGAEKAQAKALKKAQKNDGGKDMEELEALINQFKEQDRKENTVSETALEVPPSPRSHATFLAHPEKDFLVLFGGEYFNGKVTEMLNQVCLYNIKVRFRKLELDSLFERSLHVVEWQLKYFLSRILLDELVILFLAG